MVLEGDDDASFDDKRERDLERDFDLDRGVGALGVGAPGEEEERSEARRFDIGKFEGMNFQPLFQI